MDQDTKIKNDVKLLSTYSIIGTIVLNSLKALRRFDSLDDAEKVKLIYSRIKNKAYALKED